MKAPSGRNGAECSSRGQPLLIVCNRLLQVFHHSVGARLAAHPSGGSSHPHERRLRAPGSHLRPPTSRSAQYNGPDCRDFSGLTTKISNQSILGLSSRENERRQMEGQMTNIASPVKAVATVRKGFFFLKLHIFCICYVLQHKLISHMHKLARS